jgi:uncharacterized protein YecT (DUF1311 family)
VAQSVGPSFDCSKAKIAAEKVICDHDFLSAQDLSLALAYSDALTISPAKAVAIKDEQRRWLKERNKLCGLKEAQIAGQAFHCLAELYGHRLEYIENESFGPVWQNAADDPADALARLRPLRLPRARVYARYLAHALSDEDVKAFATFVDDLAEELGNANSASGVDYSDLLIPCRLVERYPRLLLAGRAYFGSTKDLMLPNIECKDWDRGVPKEIDNFLKNNPLTRQNWFDRCSGGGGTIFAAYGRDLRLHALRLARFPRSYLSDHVTWTQTPDQPWPTPEQIENANWVDDAGYEKARDALTAFYRQRFRLRAEDALTAATRAIWDNRETAENPAACLGEE